MVVLFLIFYKISMMFIYIPTNSVWEFLFSAPLQILIIAYFLKK